MRKWMMIIAVLVCPILLCSCATIISGRTQKMPVITSPSDAVVICNGVEQKSPCTLILDRSVPAYQITIKKEGYKDTTIELKRGVNGWVFGNILIGGIIGIVIDVCDSSCYAFYPDNVTQNLVPEGSDALVIKTIEGGKK